MELAIYLMLVAIYVTLLGVSFRLGSVLNELKRFRGQAEWHQHRVEADDHGSMWGNSVKSRR
jgi:hypothetical protein